MKRSFLAVVLFVAFASCSWQIVDSDFATIAIATSFWESTTGYVAGGTASVQPLFLYTTDGGNTLTNQGMNDSSVGAMLSIRMSSNGQWGIAGGLGFIEIPCGAYTNDGFTWYNMEDEFFLFCAFQGASVVDDSQTGVLVGSFSDRRDWTGNGIKITTNGGQKWSQINGDTGGTPVRYASFISKDQGYVTAGIWPEADFKTENWESMTEYPINRHLTMDILENRVKFVRPESRATTGYIGLISSVTNEGKNWKLMVNETDQGIYFNEISCTDANTCWTVAQGVDGFGNDTSMIYHTTDGWNTFDIQLTVPGASLTCIDMHAENGSFRGWTGGALLQGTSLKGDFDGIFYQTTDGINWTFDSAIKNYFPMDVSAPDSTHAYSAGITPIGLSSFASWSS